MSRHLRRRGVVLALALAAVLAARRVQRQQRRWSDASGGGSGGSGSGGGACPVGALDQAKGPVTITFWHGLNQANEKVLQGLIDQFNASQTKVKVNLVNQTGYEEILRKWVAGLGTGDLPDVAQLEDTATQQMIDTQSIVPVADCIKADGYDTSDIVGPRARALHGRRQALADAVQRVEPDPLLRQERVPGRRSRPRQAADDARRREGRRAEDQGRGLPDRLRPEAQPVVPRAVGGEGRTRSTRTTRTGGRRVRPRRCSTTRPDASPSRG